MHSRNAKICFYPTQEWNTLITKKEKQLHQAFFLLDSSAARKSWLNFEAPPPTVKAFQGKNTNNNNKTKIEHHDTQTKINSLTPKCN